MTTLWQASQQIHSAEAHPESFTEAALSAASDINGEGKRVFLSLYAEQALSTSQQAGARWLAGKPKSAIDGLPVSIKDLFDVANEATTAGSNLLASAQPAQQNATIVNRLIQAGAAIVGKTNMTEFAYSGLGINPHYGTPANPWRRDEKRIPGGSSSGAAVAVSDGMCLAAVGTDTGGSVRIPAALCGLTGFKPSARRIDQTGTLPLSTSLDSIGVIAHDVRSCWLLDAVIADAPLTLSECDLTQARFAIPQTRVLDGLDENVSHAWMNALERLRTAGATLVELPLEALAELESMNARGGITAYESWQWHQQGAQSNPEAYDPQVLIRLQRGSLLTDQDAESLHQQRAAWKNKVEAELTGFDGMLMPTVPRVAPTLAELDNSAVYMQINALMLRNPSIINMLDGCAISLPCHQADTAPVGLMLASTQGKDAQLLSWALAIEIILIRGN